MIILLKISWKNIKINLKLIKYIKIKFKKIKKKIEYMIKLNKKKQRKKEKQRKKKHLWAVKEVNHTFRV